MVISTPDVYFSSPTDPLPVIVAAPNVDNNYNSANGQPEVMIAFRKSDGIYYINLFLTQLQNTYTQLGVIHKIPYTDSNYLNPSISKNPSGKILLTCNTNTGYVFGWSTTGGSWITLDYTLFNKGNVVNLRNTSVTADNTGKFHIAYEGYNTTYNSYSILHKVINSDGYPLTPVTEFTQFQYVASNPTVSGHLDLNGGVSITFNTTSNTIRRINFDGVNWDLVWNGIAPIMQTNAAFVNAIDYMLPTIPVYCWMTVGTAPVNYNTCIGYAEQNKESKSSDSLFDENLIESKKFH